MKRTALLLVMFMVTSCTGPKVRARSFFTSKKDLASLVVDTPDPEKSTKKLGQVVWVRWRVASTEEPTTLDVRLRFQDESERRVQYPITDTRGSLLIEIPPEERLSKGGLLSYQILLLQNEKTIASTRHKLWVEKVEIKDL
jgi:hypothetical protein